MSERIDLGLRVRDHQVRDCDGRRCGKVDDLAIEGGAGEVPEVIARGTWIVVRDGAEPR